MKDMYKKKGDSTYMRTSVFTGILACALIFLVSSAKAEAASIDLLTINTTEPAIEQLLAATDSVQPTTSEVTEATVPSVVTHTIAEHETLSDIAKRYNTTWRRLYDKNPSITLPDVINPGDTLVIPTVDEVLEPRELPVAEVTVQNSGSVVSSATPAPIPVAGNRYVRGYCTWYVKNRRPDMPNNLGNAINWVSRAAAQGFATGSVPLAGAVGQQGNHVVYVESVNGDGTVTVSDMNFDGWNVVTTRTVSAVNFTYIY